MMIGSVLVAAATTSFWTASDPFVGKWRVDVSRSTIVDSMRVRSLGANRYSFNFEGGPAETVVADGTDQPGLPGTTLSVKQAGTRTLAILRKRNGEVIVEAKWTLSKDSRTLRDTFVSVQPNGTRLTVDYVYRRTSGTQGFAGAWESTTKPLGLELELEIEPSEHRGLTFASSGPPRRVIFDGRDHPAPGASNGLTLSGWRRSARSIEYRETIGGKLARVRQFRLSSGGRTLTETLRVPGQTAPDVFLFERE